jgi:hypothetical protein
MCNQVLFAHDDGAHHTCKPSFPALLAVMCHAYHVLVQYFQRQTSAQSKQCFTGPNEAYNP